MMLIIKTTLAVLMIAFTSAAQRIGINATGTPPDKSALLDLSSTDQGFLITRVDTANIASPAFGLMTLSPIDSCLYMYSGVSWSSIGGAGKNCPSCNNTPSPSFPCNGTEIPIIDVTNPNTGLIWMDRNLGASQVATSLTDGAAFGDFYQWGRCSDGHEKLNSPTTSTQSTGDTPGHGEFIIISNAPSDWRSSMNDNLWQGVNGINNPCPTGYRIPTKAEWDTERLSWSSNNSAGAFNSPLKLTTPGIRKSSDGTLAGVGASGYYWSSTVSGSNAWRLDLDSFSNSMFANARAFGFSVRCIKD